ncbi:MAG: phosphonate metabolism protein/1,5-bisphosphokinase (PRPP-forming) PhnN, partial [Notoacmeibacter sp.]
VSDPLVHFAKRIVTREANSSEDHDSVTEAEFAAMEEKGAFSLSWQANGLSYAIPALVHAILNDGGIVVANASRAITPKIKSLFPRSLIVHITASEAVLNQRLAARGREQAGERDLRLARSKALEGEFDADIRIENNGELEDAVAQFVRAISALKAVKKTSFAQ